MSTGSDAPVRPLRAWAGTFAANMAMLAIGVGTGIAAARLLGVTDRGHLAAIVIVSDLAARLGSLSLGSAMTVEVARSPGDRGLVSAGAVLALGFSAVATLAFLAIAPYDRASPYAGLIPLVVAARLFVDPLALALIGVEQGGQRFGRVNLLRMIPQTVYAGAMLALWLAGAVGVATLAWAMLAGSAATALVAAIVTGRRLLAPVRGGDLSRLLASSLRFHAREVLFIAQLYADRVLILAVLTASDLGLYAVAQTLAGAGTTKIAHATVTVLLPRISGAADTGARGAELAASTSASLVVAAVMNGVLAILAPWLVPLLFGAEFAPAAPVAIILCAAQLPMAAVMILSYGLRGMDDWTAGPVAAAIALLVFAGLGAALVGPMATTGVALALLAASLAAAAWIMRRAARRTGRGVAEFIVPPRWMLSPAAVLGRVRREPQGQAP